jgi:hypothetical protein
MTTLSDKTALIIVDVQDGLDDPVWRRRNNLDAERNMARCWRPRDLPPILDGSVIHERESIRCLNCSD